MRRTPAQAELLTVEDYRATPEGSRYQLVEGELIMSPAPNVFHQIVIGNLHLLLANFVRNTSLGRVLMAPCDVYLSEHNVVQPNVLFVAQAKLSRLAEDGVHGGPDLVVEVLSPGTARLDAGTKRRLYAKHGVKEFWLVDPLLRQIQRHDFARNPAGPVRQAPVREAQGRPVQLIAGSESFSTPLLPGLTLSAVEIFRR